MAEPIPRAAMPAPVKQRATRLPFFYGWLLVAVAFVTMAVGVNARTAFLAPVSADPRRVRLGTRHDRRSLLVRVSGVGDCDPAGRPGDGSTRAAAGGRDRRRPDGRRAVAGDSLARTLAAVPDVGRAGRRRGQLPRLYRAIAIPDQLVRAPARPGAQHRLFRRRARRGSDPALAARTDRRRGVARRLLGPRDPRAGGAGSAQSAAEAAPRGFRTRTGRHGG